MMGLRSQNLIKREMTTGAPPYPLVVKKGLPVWLFSLKSPTSLVRSEPSFRQENRLYERIRFVL